LEASVDFPIGYVYPGVSTTAELLVHNTWSEEVKITYVSYRFDWMSSSEGNSTSDMSANPAVGPSGERVYLGSAWFRVPSNARVGDHVVQILIKGQRHGASWYDFSVSTIGSITIHSSYERTYRYNLHDETWNKIRAAQNANFLSPTAQSLLKQAENEFGAAMYWANYGDWQQAVESLQNASSLIDEANVEETAYEEQQTLQYAVIAGALVAAVAIVAVAVFVFRRKKRSNET
jgi:hypothetical protein